ncbi:ribonuclease H-like domain-containing protein [Tanacetum coccineum]
MSTTKLPILKKGEYNIWAMKMEHYLTHIDYPIWEVIQRGNGPKDSTKVMISFRVFSESNLRFIVQGVSTEDCQSSSLRYFYSVSTLLARTHKSEALIIQLMNSKMDLKWQVAMISMRLKKFYKKTRRRMQFDAKEPVGFDKTKVECFNCHNTWHFARECRSKGNQESKRRDAGNTGYKAKDNGRRPGK